MARLTNAAEAAHYDFPEQRIRDKAKESSEWYIKCTNYIIDRALGADDKKETLANIGYANGEFDEETIAYALSPYSKDIGQQSKQLKFPNTIRKIDIISNIKERYMGEFIKQYSNYQVYIHDSDSVFARNEQLKKAIMTKLLNKFQELVDTGDEEKVNNLDLDKFSKEFIEEWKDERVIKAQHRLNLINDLTESDIKYIQAFFYWWATEEVYSYRKIINNELYKEIVPPWEYYRVDSGNMFVEDDDMGMRRYKMSINQIIDHFRDRISDKDMEYLRILLDKAVINEDMMVTPELLNSREVVHMYHKSVSDLGSLSFSDASRMLDVYHCVWKTETLIYNLKYYDFISGEIKTIQVPQTYKLDESSGDISLEEEWINEVMETYRFGNKFEGIYLPATKVEVQRQEINNSSICKLPYNGINGLVAFNKKNPIPKRLIVYQQLLQLYHFQREKAIAKFKSFNLIPESLLLDSAEMTTAERLAYAAMDDLFPFNDSDVDPSVMQAIKNLYNSGAERYIQILGEVINSLRSEAMDAAHMNEQRYGDIASNAGKSVTEYAITKATTGSIWLYEMFNKFRERDYAADLDYSKAAWIDGKKGSYIDPATKDVVYVDIDGVEELGTNIGVFIKNSALEEEKLKAYRELAFSASQNGELSVAADAIATENSTEIRRIIKKAEEARKEYERSIQQSTEQLQMQLAEQHKQVEDMKHNNNKEITILKELEETKRAMAKLQVEILKINSNTPDNNTVPSEYQQSIDKANQALAMQQQALNEFKAQVQADKAVAKTV